MLENPKRIRLKFNILVLFFLFIGTNSLAQNLYLKNLKLHNLPDIYGDVFKSFFLENFNLSTKKEDLDLEIEIRWLSFNYNICFFIKKEDKYILEDICFTSLTAENILDNLRKSIKNSKYLKLKKVIKNKVINLKIVNPKGEAEKHANIISTKGDKLTDFKEIYKYKGEKGKFITIGGASAVHDIIVIPENGSAFLLQKFLNGYKIDKVYLLK